MKYSIVIPCYNESENLDNLLRQILPLVMKYDLEYVLVENGSTDNSRELFVTIPEMQDEHIIKVYVEKNQGYGYGLQQGLKVCTGDYVGWIHADLQLKPTELIPFFEFLDRYGMKRRFFLKGMRSNRMFLDCFFTMGMSVFETILFRTKMLDIGAIPVLFCRDLLKEFYHAPYDFSFELYVYLQAKKKRYIVRRKNVKLGIRKRGVSSWDKGLYAKLKQSIKIVIDSIMIVRGEQV